MVGAAPICAFELMVNVQLEVVRVPSGFGPSGSLVKLVHWAVRNREFKLMLTYPQA